MDGENTCLNIKTLIIDNCLIIQHKNLNIFPKLEKCDLNDVYNIIKYNKIINFQSLKNLKILNLEACYFLYLKYISLLEDVTLYSNVNSIKNN